MLFEKGFSQQDWLRLTRAPRENLALAGLQGVEVDRLRDVLGRSGGRKIPLEEVARHKSEDDVWRAVVQLFVVLHVWLCLLPRRSPRRWPHKLRYRLRSCSFMTLCGFVLAPALPSEIMRRHLTLCGTV